MCKQCEWTELDSVCCCRSWMGTWTWTRPRKGRRGAWATRTSRRSSRCSRTWSSSRRRTSASPTAPTRCQSSAVRILHIHQYFVHSYSPPPRPVPSTSSPGPSIHSLLLLYEYVSTITKYLCTLYISFMCYCLKHTLFAISSPLVSLFLSCRIVLQPSRCVLCIA